MSTKLTFWQNTLSIHQAPLIRELASRQNVQIRVVVESGISTQRAKLGWSEPDYGAAEIHIAPNQTSLRTLVKASHDDNAHIFSGVDVYPLVEMARSALLGSATGKLIASTEAVDTRGVLRKLRFWARKKTLTARLTEYSLVLACGALAVAQWRKCGATERQIREFGYFVDRAPSEFLTKNISVYPPQIVFVGSLESRKDPDTLLRALSRLPTEGWQAAFVGDGPLLPHLRKRAKKLGIAENVKFHGTLPNGDGRRVTAESTVLVLPSKHDGWGAVVNEALMDGIPSVVSRSSGASTLIRTPIQGSTFRAGDAKQLAQALCDVLTENRTITRQEDLAAWSDKWISPRAAADYLLEIVHSDNGAKLDPPWAR